MSYPGNTSLSAEVQERIQSSFSQTVGLARQGNESEAQLGCEFILGMDPLFRPATQLLERLRGDQRPLALDDLTPSAASAEARPAEARPAAAQPAQAAPQATPSVGDTGVVTADDLFEGPADAPTAEPSDGFSALPDLDSLTEDGAAAGALPDPGATQPTAVRPEGTPATPAPDTPSAAAEASAPAGGLGVVLQDLLDRGKNEQVLQIAENQRAAIEADPQLAAMVTEAQTRLETAQYVTSFLDAARRARSEGKQDEAERLLAKARILDPEHPDLAAFEAEAGADAGATAEDGEDELPGLLREPPSDAHELEVASNAGGAAEEGAVEEAVEEEESGRGWREVPLASSDSDAEPEGGDRIDSLLAEGQAALDRGEFQDAIDIWSRIFLIDIDNAEASERIEEARRQKAEAEREADEVFHDGVDKVEAGDTEGAAQAFRRVLELQPGHAMASEYLEQLESGQVPDRPRRPSQATIAPEVPFAAPGEGDEEAPSLEAAVERDRVVAVRRTDKRLLMIGALVSLVVVVGGFLLFRYRDAIFPNAGDEQAAPAAPNPQLARAGMLFERGSTETAIKLLETIAADDPSHAQAQALLTQYRAAAEPPDEEPPPEQSAEAVATAARRARMVEAAGTAAAAGENVLARRLLGRAADLAPLEGEDAALAARVGRALQPLEDQLEGFEDGSWERILPELWRLLDDDPANPDVRLLIADSYYNLALRALQRGTPADATAMLQSALEVDADNDTLRRMLAFAETYEQRPQDLLYRIYVKYLPSKT